MKQMFEYRGGMAGRRRSWRIMLTWESARDSPTGEPVQIVEVTTVGQLRQLVIAARANPRVVTYSYRGHRAWDDAGAPRTCRQGHELTAGRSGGRDCLCGTGHFESHCWCGDVRYVPELGPGCGEVPFDPEAGKHHWQPRAGHRSVWGSASGLHDDGVPVAAFEVDRQPFGVRVDGYG